MKSQACSGLGLYPCALKQTGKKSIEVMNPLCVCVRVLLLLSLLLMLYNATYNYNYICVDGYR